ncbi:hypothetical protein ACQRBH_05940 [Bariatricus sp. SGI.161]|uniref:hypothetical protein n=1 Tax=Bariatricus sp. SGI.161 TaxID=3420550 RepID=UPI003CFFCA91
MDEKIKRIKSMYNDCAKSFGIYEKDHKLDAFSRRSEQIVRKYGCLPDIIDLMFWWYQMAQSVHDLYEKEVRDNG